MDGTQQSLTRLLKCRTKSSEAQTCQLAALSQTQGLWSTPQNPVAPFLRCVGTRIRCGVIYLPRGRRWKHSLWPSCVACHPLKAITIPRMELKAAVVAVQLHKFLEEQLNLPVHRAVFWTESAIVLQYIRNEARRFQTFVANQLSVIHDATSLSQWHHVDSQFNPADYASRDFSITESHKL